MDIPIVPPHLLGIVVNVMNPRAMSYSVATNVGFALLSW